MIATKNTNFPYLTVSSAKLIICGSHMADATTRGTILVNTNARFEAQNCVDLVYHADAETAKAYQKELLSF